MAHQQEYRQPAILVKEQVALIRSLGAMGKVMCVVGLNSKLNRALLYLKGIATSVNWRHTTVTCTEH